MAEAYGIDKAGNAQIVYSSASFVADFIAPSSTVTWPSTTPTAVNISSVTGTVSDPAPGNVAAVKVSFFRNDGAGSGGQKYWDPVARTFSSATELFSTAAVTGGTWNIPSADVPTWVTSLGGISYLIFAEGIDAAGNITAKPGSTNPGTSYVNIVMQAPAPVSTITSPDGTTPNFKPTTVVLQGTTINSTTAYVQILDCGADLVCGTGNDDLAWNGSAFVSTGTFNGFRLVNTFTGSFLSATWQFTEIPTGSWNNNRIYKITSQGYNGNASIMESPGPNASFIIDNTAPTGAIQLPDSRATQNSVPTLSATASDTTPGTVQTVVFHAVRSEDGTKFWNWQASTFTSVSSPATDLTATFSGGLWSYTTDYFQINTGTGAWENGRSYVIHEVITDKAGNQTDIAHAAFTYDIIAPTATIQTPVLASTSGIKALPVIAGIASDNYVPQNVQIAIQNQTSHLWFDGSNFTVSGAANFLPVTTLTSGATQWTYTAGGILDGKLIDGFKCTVVARSSDVASNRQSIFNLGTSSCSFVMDKTPPNLSLSAPPLNGSSYKPANIGKSASSSLINGTDSDSGSGVKRVQIELSYLLVPNTYYWDGSSFSSTTVNGTTAWQSVNNPGPSWSYPIDIAWPTDQSHAIQLQVRGEDNALNSDGTGPGNLSTPGTVGVDILNFNVDIASPTGVVTAPAAATKINSLSNILGTAADDLSGVGSIDIEISSGTGTTFFWNDSGAGWTIVQHWNSVTPATSWSYPAPALATGTDYYSR